MSFTPHIRSLELGREPDPDVLEALLGELRSVLVSEMKRRSLWSASPSYLGICGARRWSDDDALDELLHDSYITVVLRRLPVLKAALEKLESVDGLMVRNLRNFLSETQKKHDPLGYRVFSVLRGAVEQALDAGTLQVLEGDPGRLRNETVLGFAAESPPPESAPAAPAELEVLTEPIRDWVRRSPELVTAGGRKRREVEEELGSLVAGLEDRGLSSFRLKEVADVLKREVRSRWNAVGRGDKGETAREAEDGELGRIVNVVRPDSGFEERQFFQKLLECMAEGLARSEDPDDLRKLWLLLRNHAAGEPTDGAETEKPPSGRRIAELLDIPRYRLPRLRKCLGDQVEMCRAALSHRSAPGGAP